MKLRHIAGAILVMLFFIMLLGIEQSLGDVSNTGSSTNTQSHTGSGSNTTISGGYSQESTTTYQSGSSSS